MTNRKDLVSDYTLRAVGQGLESLDIVDFDLEAKGDGYFVLGKPAPSKPEKTANAKSESSLGSTLQSAWENLVARVPMNGKAPEATPHVLRVLFTPEGIQRLDNAGKAKRDSASVGIPNLNRLSQILRMVGEYISLKSGRLLKVSKRQDSISFEYETALDGRTSETWKISDLYDFWLQLSDQRKNRYEIVEKAFAPGCEKLDL
jgi:hypothetical protein